MITVQEATRIILENCFVPKPEPVSITDAVGRVISEPIIADRNFPPFDRVTMDGIAIDYEAYKTGRREFLIEDTQAAGQPVKTLKDLDQCIEVMTGAVLPENTDTVIPYEDIELRGSVAFVKADVLERRQNIHSVGQDAKRGDVLVEPGTVLSAAEIALLATVGMSKVDVLCFPKAAVVSSGDELVDIEKVPEPHQIRRSNTYAIHAAMKKVGWNATQFHLPDDEELLKKSLTFVLAEHDVLILSGGVSKGKFDFIPRVLDDIGVKNLFHQVSQRPGKPFWFGVTNSGKVVFALPGNPVSTFMCFYRYIMPWFWTSMVGEYHFISAVLAKDFKFQPKLTHFLQVAVRNEGGVLTAYPEKGGGSGDFANLKNVDGFLELPLEKVDFKAGERYTFIPFR
jgi:molybdopterin molybdotransferase